MSRYHTINNRKDAVDRKRADWSYKWFVSEIPDEASGNRRRVDDFARIFFFLLIFAYLK